MSPPEPRVGVGAAIHDAQNRLLLLQRRTEPEALAWGLPGGKLDFREKVEDAVLREIAEELDITIELTGLYCIAETIDAGDGCHWVAPVLTAKIVSGEPRVREPDKHKAWGWFASHEMPEHLTTPTRDYLRTRRQSMSSTH